MITTLAQFINEGINKSSPKYVPGLKDDVLSVEEAVAVVKARCPEFDPHTSPLFFRGRKNNPNSQFFLTDPKRRHRLSTANHEHYGLLMDQLLSWQRYPSRNRSIIFTNSKSIAYNYGHMHFVFPLDKANIGVSPTGDIFNSFSHLYNKVHLSITDLSMNLQNIGVNGYTWDVMRHDMDELWDRLDDVDLPSFTIYKSALINYLVQTKRDGGEWLEALEELVDPVKNGFKLATYDGAFLQGTDSRGKSTTGNMCSLEYFVSLSGSASPSNESEMWTDSECLMVNSSYAKTFYDAFIK